jgi:hypothetical protein
MGLDTKTYRLTDGQSQCDFDFDFDLTGVEDPEQQRYGTTVIRELSRIFGFWQLQEMTNNELLDSAKKT